MPEHFDHQDPLAHVLQKRIEGMTSVSEAHGTEMPGYLSAAFDACKESSVMLLLVWILFPMINFPLLIALGLGWCAWKGGRSGWLGWSRLERLHRLIEQEKYEIEHHRHQERQEIMALYKAKGFEGKLLEEVTDVLMADQDRLLKVMLEEEMGLTLQAYQHPLQQALGGAIGSLIALVCSTIGFYFIPVYGMLIAAFLLVGFCSGFAAHFEQNKMIPAVVWNLSIAALAFGISYLVAVL